MSSVRRGLACAASSDGKNSHASRLALVLDINGSFQ
jgi:hypothetical protein